MVGRAHFWRKTEGEGCMSAVSIKPKPVRRRLFLEEGDSQDPSPASQSDPTPPPAKRAKLSPQKQAELLAEYTRVKSASPQRPGAVAELCHRFGVNRSYCFKLLGRLNSPSRTDPFTPTRRAGRPSKLSPTKHFAMSSIMQQNGYKLSLRALESEMQHVGASSKGASRATLQRWTQKLGWRRVQVSSKPMLTDDHKKNRLAWALRHANHDWSCTVDIDEKWFFGTLLSGKLHLPPGVSAPRTPVQSKRFIPKVMFLTAVAPPDPDNNFDGKIGCWAITEKYTAKRNSKHFQKGDVYDKQVSMDSKKFLDMLRTLVIPAIRRKMTFKKSVQIQMDNAPPHGALEALEQDINRGRKSPQVQISFLKQPPQSPDCNVNDLGLYNSMQTRLGRQQTKLQSTGEIMRSVKNVWAETESATIQKLFETKKMVLGKIVEARGSHDYSFPHTLR